MSLIAYKNILPRIGQKVFIAPSADVIGNVEIADNSSVWFACVIRGDVNFIKIGPDSNIQDGTMIHVTRKTHPTIIGQGVTIGHKALLHGCTIGDYAFVGMGATVMDGAMLEPKSMLAAGALLAPRTVIPSGQLYAGIPARPMRALSSEELEYLEISAANYIALKEEYLTAK